MRKAWKIAGGVLAVVAAWGYLAYGLHAVWPSSCPGGTMKVEAGEVRTVQLDHDRLAVAMAFPNQHVVKVVVYDYCKGQVLSSIEASQ